VHEFYQVLGVRSGAADAEIKAAFRRLAKQLHPDLRPGDANAERQLQHVIRAYETLCDRPSRMAYDAGLALQRSLRRWRFRANAMTVVAAFALTVSVGLHWRVLSQAILPSGELPTRLADNETHTAISDKAEMVPSSMQGRSAVPAEVPGDAAPNRSPELNAEPSHALLDRSSAKEVVDGSFAQPTTAGASPLQSLPLANLDVNLDPGNETAVLQRSLQSKRSDLNAEPSSALQDHSFANELVDASPAKAATAEVSSLKSLALVDPEPVLYSANEATAPQSLMPQGSNKTQGGSAAGWWVILGSINVGEADSAMTMVTTGVRRASGAAHRCGMSTFNDLSSKFRGFAPGYMVVVIGPFAEKADAARSQQRVNGCISGSYVKYALHLGE